MIFLLMAIVLQVQIALPDRAKLENPAITSPLPKQIQKDYDKLWKRFLSGKEDAKVFRESEKLLKKSGEAIPILMVQSYIDLYAGRQGEAERRLQVVLAKRPADTAALTYLAELAYSQGDFVRATELFSRLRAANPSVSGIELKSQRSLLLAMDTLLQSARRAASEDQLGEAERLYRHALELAPGEAALHGQLAEILLRQGRREEADASVRRQVELLGSGEFARDRVSIKVIESMGKITAEGLDDVGRWGSQIDRFREIRDSQSLTREQLAALLAGYFPQLRGLGQSPEIMTDVEGTWAESAIQAVVAAGLLDSMANHTFQPARTVNRGEFARAIARLALLLGVSSSDAPSVTPLDVVPDSTLHRELQPVLGYELLTLDNAGNFNVGAPVRGEEAVNTAEKLLRLFHKKAA